MRGCSAGGMRPAALRTRVLSVSDGTDGSENRNRGRRKAGSGKMQPEPACAPLQTGDFCGAALCGDAGRKDPARGRAFLRGAGRIPAKKVRGMKDVRAGRMLRTAGSFGELSAAPRFIRGMLWAARTADCRGGCVPESGYIWAAGFAAGNAVRMPELRIAECSARGGSGSFSGLICGKKKGFGAVRADRGFLPAGRA